MSTTAYLRSKRDKQQADLVEIRQAIACTGEQIAAVQASLAVLRTQHAEVLMKEQAQHALVLCTQAELNVSEVRDKQVEKARLAENSVLEKHRYTQRCWQYLVRHHAKKNKKHANDRNRPAGDVRFAGTWDLQHPQFSWDEIIAMAHESHFNGLVRNEVGSLLEYDWQFPNLESLIALEKRDKYGCWSYSYDRNGHEIPPTISPHDDMESIRKFPNRHDFTIDTYPKNFGFVNHYY